MALLVLHRHTGFRLKLFALLVNDASAAFGVWMRAFGV
jgi:hypothetical protein